MNEKKAIVIGAGITGLATAWNLVRDGYEVTIIEKADEAGGMAGTIDWDGWKFDYGVHSFHSKHQDIIKFLTEELPGEFLERKIAVKLYIFGKLMNYPIVGAQVFSSLSGVEAVLAGIDFVIARIKAYLFGIKETEYLDEWIIRRFGERLYKAYFKPYIERIQKKDIKFLSSDIGKKKIPIFSIRQYLLREITRNKVIHPDEKILFHTYYCRGGFGKICEYFMEDCQQKRKLNVKLGQKIRNIALEGNRITRIETEDENYVTKDTLVISTIPLEGLFEVMECVDDLKQQSRKLEYTSARFLLVKLRRESVSHTNWTNFNGEEFVFNRVSEHRFDGFEMVPEKGHSSLTFEFPLNKGDECWNMSDKELFEKILPAYDKIYPLKKEDVIDLKSLWIDYATPRMTIGYNDILNSLFSFTMNVENLFCIGRQGVFSYMNADQCIRFAIDFCGALKVNKAKQWQRHIIKTLHNVDLGETK